MEQPVMITAPAPRTTLVPAGSAAGRPGSVRLVYVTLRQDARNLHHHRISRRQWHDLAVGHCQCYFRATVTFTMTPNTGYHVSDVLVDVVSQGAITSYTFPDVIENHTIAASFAPDDTTPPTGSIVINNGAAFTNSSTVTLTLSAIDTEGSVTEMQFSNDGMTWSMPEGYATSKAGR